MATGFTFLSPGGVGRLGGDKGESVIRALGGTVDMLPRTQTTMWILNSNAFLGLPIRLTAMLSVSHMFRMLDQHFRRPAC